MQTSDSIAALAAALAKAQGAIEAAKKDSDNPHFKSKYADLASIWTACRTQLSANGIAVVQAPGTDEGGSVTITTTLAHSSGEWMRSTMACKPGRPDAQSLGSVITYLRRYSLAAMVGVAPDEDDDGEAAVGRGKDMGKPVTSMAPANPPRQRQSNSDDPEVVAKNIKQVIDGAVDIEALNKAMGTFGYRPGSDTPTTGSALSKVKEHSAQAYKFLIDRAANRRSVFVPEPPSFDDQEAA